MLRSRACLVGCLVIAACSQPRQRGERRDRDRDAERPAAADAATPSPPVDPLIAMITAARPAAKTALVLGVGSAATELTTAGVSVTAVEADGLAYLRDHDTRFDVVVLDAFVGTRPPPELITPEALALLRARTADGGVTVVHLRDAPADPVVARIRAALRRTATRGFFDHVLGSGVGAEAQDLTVLASDAPLSWRQDAGLPLWPLYLDGDAFASVAIAGASADGALTRSIAVVGYLHASPDGALALDVAHGEMGAARYLLVGAAAESLRARLPADARFPTQGDLATDGDTRDTLRALLGGGGVKRSDVRFSPIVAAVSGTARLISIIHPDAASGVPGAAAATGAVVDDRLRWGGALYQLEVATIDTVVDLAAGRALDAAIQAELTAATAAATRGDLTATDAALGRATAAVTATFAARAPLVSTARLIERWRAALVTEREPTSRGGFAAAAACDRMQARIDRDDPEARFAALAAGFLACAAAGYEPIARTDPGAYGYDAAARLLFFLDRRTDALPAPLVKRAAALRRDLGKQHKAQPLIFPPGWIQ